MSMLYQHLFYGIYYVYMGWLSYSISATSLLMKELASMFILRGMKRDELLYLDVGDST